MKKVDSILLASLLLAAALPASAQTGNSPGNGAQSRTAVRSDVGLAPIFPYMFEPIAVAGLLNDRLVKNQPVAAVFESETSSFQPNGNPITSRVTIRIYRDNEGRTRREVISYPGNASSGSSQTAASTAITIDDPVSGFTYLLDQQTKTVQRYKLTNAHPQQGNSFNDIVPRVVELLRNDDLQTGMVRKYRLDPPKLEPLGRQQIIPGVEAEGRRLIFKIPAGAIGNAAEVESTYEIWIARDLRMLVKSVTKNPLTGEHNLRLTTISRDEQPVSLFEVPSGYTMQESGTIRTDMPPPY